MFDYESKGREFESRRAHLKGDFERGLLFLMPQGLQDFFEPGEKQTALPDTTCLKHIWTTFHTVLWSCRVENGVIKHDEI